MGQTNCCASSSQTGGLRGAFASLCRMPTCTTYLSSDGATLELPLPILHPISITIPSDPMLSMRACFIYGSDSSAECEVLAYHPSFAPTAPKLPTSRWVMLSIASASLHTGSSNLIRRLPTIICKIQFHLLVLLSFFFFFNLLYLLNEQKV